MEPYEGQEPYIFTSYARKDWKRVKPFLDALSDAGYRVWYDAGIQAGADWLDTLLEKVENCAVFCPLFSEAFKDSYYCSEETKWAYRKQKIIVPLHLEKMTPDGLPRLYELLQGRQDLRLYEYADAAQFAERLGRERAFALCKAPEWNKVGLIQWRFANGVLKIAKNDMFYGDYGYISDCQEDPVQGSTTPWIMYRTKILSVEIRDDIYAIGDCAFYGCESLTSVRIPDNVTKIGNGAFYGCKSLTSVCIPDSVTVIGAGVFWGCKHLQDVRIPDSVIIIDDSAFYGCERLTGIRIPDGVTKIGDCAFESCVNIMDVRIPDSVTEIGECAFLGCGSLTNVCIPDGVTKIGDYAFWDCENLKSVEIPAGAEVGQHAFPEHTRVIRRAAP